MFEVAEKGTLFLDEVGEMSPWTQVKLLRALQDKRIRRVGGTEEIPVDVRIIAASNQDLKKRINEGQFREDLFYRLNVISFEMPPLRKRKEDIPLLVTHFLEKYCNGMGRKMKRIAPEVFDVLEIYPWPGNVRELENAIERVVAIEERATITKGSLPQEMLHLQPDKNLDAVPSLEPGFDLNTVMDEISSGYVKQALHYSKGNLKEAANVLGVNYRSLRYLVEKHGLKSASRENKDDLEEEHAV
jgi:transcriptional regulator with PAS, ATPase and Fis domain